MTFLWTRYVITYTKINYNIGLITMRAAVPNPVWIAINPSKSIGMSSHTKQCLIHGEGGSWSWSYGSWIKNYLCHQCLSPQKLWVQIPLMGRCIRYNIMWFFLQYRNYLYIFFQSLIESLEGKAGKPRLRTPWS
jgi:hypothetical protein